MATRYAVSNYNGREFFTKPVIDSLKNLGMVKFKGSRQTAHGLVYEYYPALDKS